MSTNRGDCKVCGTSALEEICDFRELPRVTSDCAPFRGGGRLLVCGQCGGAQSPADQQWFDEIGEIYNAYRSFQIYGGPEQQVLDAATGKLRRRSLVLLDRLSSLPGFPKQGSVLDIGCGAGATLRGFSEHGGWDCFGLEMDDRDLPLLRSIPGFQTLYTCPARELPRQFDAITMVHSLEHFPDPADVLMDLRSKLAPGGRLFVQVPNAAANAMDLVVADHMSHFTPVTLGQLAARTGYAVESLSTLWISKELSLTARASDDAAPGGQLDASEAIGKIRSQVAWLRRLGDAARDAAGRTGNFGIFGATIAASWLCGLLGSEVKFFVDEDPNRVGRTHLDRPVLPPDQVPSGSVVFLALTPLIAAQVAARQQRSTVEYRLPPD
jgi:SAM-dependent methyltransferase